MTKRHCSGCSHPTICKTHGCAAVEYRRNTESEAMSNDQFITVPILQNFEPNKVIGELRIRSDALPPDPFFAFSIGWRQTRYADRPTGTELSKHYELVSVSITPDPPPRQATANHSIDWQPIETAPKDEGKLLLGWVDGLPIVICWQSPCSDHPELYGWCHFKNEDDYGEAVLPTHWAEYQAPKE